jgi:hypothetical protein
MPFSPDIAQRDLLLAQNYLIKQNSENIPQNILNRISTDSILASQEKEAYERVYKDVSNNTNTSYLIESYISEKSYDTNKPKSNKSVIQIDIQKNRVKDEISKTIDDIDKIIKKFKIDKIKSIDYESERKNFKNYKIEPGMNKKDYSKKSFKNY